MKITSVIIASITSIVALLALASTAKAQAYYGPYTYPYYAPYVPPVVVVPNPQAYNYHRDLWGLGERCDSYCQQLNAGGPYSSH